MKIYYNISILIFIAVFCLAGCSKKSGEGNPELQSQKISFFYSGTDTEGHSVLYKYNIGQKKAVPYFIFKNERLISLSFSKDYETGFALTAEDINTGRENPSISGIKIYYIVADSLAPVSMQKLGNALQLFMLRTPEDNLQLIKQLIDPSITNYLKQTTIVYNNFGKEVFNKTTTYDITKEGMPVPPEKQIKTTSPDNKYAIFFSGSDKKKLAIKNVIEGGKKLITNLESEFIKAEWSSDNKYLAFSAGNISTPNYKTSIYLYSIIKGNILDTLKIDKLVNYSICRDYLVFSEIKKGKSVISILDLNNPQMVQHVNGTL